MSQTPNSIKRAYAISDSEMLEDSKTVHELYVNDMADFNNFDSLFDMQFANDWQNAYSLANDAPTDELYRDQIQGKTEKVVDAMAACRKKYNETKYYVKKAFPNSLAIQQEFGLDDYDKARKSDLKLFEFMSRMHTIADKYKAELTDAAVGYTLAKISEIQALATILDTQNIDQEVYVKGQLTTTQDRVIKMNDVWGFRSRIAEAAKLIYEDNFAKYQQYLLPATGSNAEDYAILGTVTDATTNAPIENARLILQPIGAKVYSNSLGKYGFADNLPPGDYNLEVEALDYSPKSAQITVISADETITNNFNLVKP